MRVPAVPSVGGSGNGRSGELREWCPPEAGGGILVPTLCCQHQAANSRRGTGCPPWPACHRGMMPISCVGTGDGAHPRDVVPTPESCYPLLWAQDVVPIPGTWCPSQEPSAHPRDVLPTPVGIEGSAHPKNMVPIPEGIEGGAHPKNPVPTPGTRCPPLWAQKVVPTPVPACWHSQKSLCLRCRW